MDSAALLRTTQVLISIGVAIQAAETLVARRLFSPAGLYDWRVLSTNARWTARGVGAALLNVLLSCPGILVLVCLQLLAALLVLSGLASAWMVVAVGIMLIVHMLFLFRNQYGTDGSDQMMLLVLAALFVYYLHPTSRMLTIVFGFVAGQLVVAYLTSGVAKAISPVWRSGKAIAGILNTHAYGAPSLARFFSRHRWAARAACWGVLCYECCGPVVCWIDPRVALGFFAAGAAFHFTIGLCMGLNIFFWSFTATYPAVYYFAQKFGGVLVH